MAKDPLHRSHLFARTDSGSYIPVHVDSQGNLVVAVAGVGGSGTEQAQIDQWIIGLKTEFDFSSSVIYKGTAPQGTLTSDAAWVIERITLVQGSPTEKVWAPEDSVWDNHLTLTYS